MLISEMRGDWTMQATLLFWHSRLNLVMRSPVLRVKVVNETRLYEGHLVPLT